MIVFWECFVLFVLFLRYHIKEVGFLVFDYGMWLMFFQILILFLLYILFYLLFQLIIIELLHQVLYKIKRWDKRLPFRLFKSYLRQILILFLHSHHQNTLLPRLPSESMLIMLLLQITVNLLNLWWTIILIWCFTNQLLIFRSNTLNYCLMTV